MDILEGQTEPLTLRWASDGTGNPFDLTDEEKAKNEVAEIRAVSEREKQKVVKSTKAAEAIKKRTAKQEEEE